MNGNTTTESPTTVESDIERARGLLAMDEVTPDDRRWLEQAVHRAGGADTPEGGYLWGIVKTIGRKDKARADSFLAASLQRREDERLEKARQRVENWKALPPMVKAAHLINERNRDTLSQRILQVAVLESSDLSATEPPETFESPNHY